jgi:hypothetical protein
VVIVAARTSAVTTQDNRGEAARGTDTRARIQQVAVELFAEQGYEKTSLREIAERLHVTKAALYYHFKSKEDIVASLVADYVGQIDALIGWRPSRARRTPERKFSGAMCPSCPRATRCSGCCTRTRRPCTPWPRPRAGASCSGSG